ncbi:MAG: hypothetical protein NTU44_00415 [Bacteroidetes bacterium]|nr:hypothetical protein [Bacteroidota bacterium]
MEIEHLLHEHPDLSTEIQYTDLPAGEFIMAELAMIEVFQQGEEEPIFSYDLTLDVSDKGEITLFCFDVTFRDEPYTVDMVQATRRLRQLLTVYKLYEVTPEKIVVDFFQKMAASETDKTLEFFSEN